MGHNSAKNEQRAPLVGERLIHRRRVREYEKRSHRRLCYALYLCAIALFTVMVSFSLVRLGQYAWHSVQARRISAQLRDAYRTQEHMDDAPSLPDDAPGDEGGSAQPASPPDTQIAAGQKLLPVQEYPRFDTAMRLRFNQLQQQNRDIIAWVTIEGILDEPVVQRDNEYYLRRDYLGYHNINGAIFLDEHCNLKQRPYTYILYGHNMKTEAMFGCLHQYDTPTFYRAHPFITFDTMYESGRYVVFSVVTADETTVEDLNKMASSTVMWREEAIASLCKQSRYSPKVDVAPDDQVLLLVTCITEGSSDRRVIAARRIREGETEKELYELVQRSFRQR